MIFDYLDLMTNVLPVKIVTVNCARIIHGNQVATNGVVHVIDRVISAVATTIKNVLDARDELSQFNVCNMDRALSRYLKTSVRPTYPTLWLTSVAVESYKMT